MPFHCYGEHGGLPNREHRAAGVGMSSRWDLARRLGLGRNHHADVLDAPLLFLPPYAQGSRFRYLRVRLEAKAAGLLRLVAGRTIAPNDPISWGSRLKIFGCALLRLATPY
jgi:hypothetical protein